MMEMNRAFTYPCWRTESVKELVIVKGTFTDAMRSG
jgi:hypothetical protein